MKKILIITDTFLGMAGSERNITQLLNYLNKDHFELTVACIQSGELSEGLAQQGFAVHALRQGGLYTPNGIKNIRFLRKVIIEKGISLILTYHEASDFYGLLLSKLCGIPVVTNRRDMGFKIRRHHRLAYRLFGRQFAGVITVCDAIKEEFSKRGWFKAEVMHTIHNGVHLEEYDSKTVTTDSLKRTLGLDEGPLIGLIANLRKIKGIDYFIGAASILKTKINNIHFVVIGADMDHKGYTRDDLSQRARERQVHDRVHFLGERDDIPALISAFDIAVVSSLSEGFSNSILEYMASSKPVVATQVGGNGEAVADGKTGFLVPPADSAALAEAMLKILQDKELADRFGRAARERVEEKFSLAKMMESYESYFFQMSNKHQPTHSSSACHSHGAKL